MKHFITTRGMLASRLMAYGYKAEQVPNPYKPERTMWSIAPVDQRLLDVVKAYYAETGKEPPEIIKQWQHAIDKGERL